MTIHVWWWRARRSASSPLRIIMPEIAEVERARTILEQILKNQKILDVETVYPLCRPADLL